MLFAVIAVIRCTVEDPFRTEHLLGVVINWPSAWPER
jgi:hypothetical protein